MNFVVRVVTKVREIKEVREVGVVLVLKTKTFQEQQQLYHFLLNVFKSFPKLT